MAIEESLLQAIKKDNKEAFDALLKDANGGACRLGRFPLLSLLYLYRARRLLAAYEEPFLQFAILEPLREPMEISGKFAGKAGKCLRLYLNEVVSPFEMLLILNRTRHLKKLFPLAKTSSAVKARLKSIYNIKYSLSVRFEGDNIIMDRRPLSFREKRYIALICMCAILVVTIAVGVPVTTTMLIPKPVAGEVTKLGNIDFNSTNDYTLKKDIVLPENYSVEKINCNIIGDGKKLILSSGVSLGEFNGSMSDLIIESSGTTIFTSISEKAKIENVTLNVNADIEVTESTAFFAQTNYGMIDGVTVNISGAVNVAPKAREAAAEITFGGVVQNNASKYNPATQTAYNGVVNNCTVNYSQLALVGEVSANATFGGIVGVNSGYVQYCTVKGEIIADTVDVAGVCVTNNGSLYGNVNEANISQTSNNTGWNPIVCGIVVTNFYTVVKCENRGSLYATSTCEPFEGQKNYTATAVGIAHENRVETTKSYIQDCVNTGNIKSVAEQISTYAAGVCAILNGEIESCKNTGNITANAGNGCDVYIGGITAIADVIKYVNRIAIKTYAEIIKSVNEGSIVAMASGTACVGGIAAFSDAAFISNCFSSGDIKITASNVYMGGILGVSDVAIYDDMFYGRNFCSGGVDFCISRAKIDVSISDNSPAYVGGAVGYVREIGVNNGNSIVYFGGSVTDCYYLGECLSEVEYFGNIVGVCGANIYESNSFTSGGMEYHNFESNYYLSGSAKTAFGATMTPDGTFASATDKGATSATLESIQALENYQSILTTLAELEN